MHHTVKLLIIFTALFGVSSATQSFINKTDFLGNASVLSTMYDNGPEVKLYNGRSYNHGDTLAVGWSKNDAGGGCTSLNGWVETRGSNQGYDERTIDACGSANHDVNIECYAANGQRMGNTIEKFTINTNTCPSGNSGPVCGNGICQSGETSSSCPSDCGTGGGGGEGGGGGGGGASTTTVSLVSDRTTVNFGESATLMWTSSNASSCLALAGAGFEVSSTSGSDVVAPLGGTSTFAVQCTNGSSTAQANVTITLNPQPDVVAYLISDRTNVNPGDTVRLSWDSENATACTGVGAEFETGGQPSGSDVVAPLTTTTTFSIQCTNGSKTGGASVIVTVGDAVGANAPRIVSFTAARPLLPSGQRTSIRWEATNATSCTGTGFNTAGAARNTVGVQTAILTTTTTYGLDCVNGAEHATATLTIMVTGATQGAPAIDSFTTDRDTISAGGTVRFSWQSTNTASCTGSGQGFAEKVLGRTSATDVISDPLQGTTTFSLTCINSANLAVSAVKTVTVGSSSPGACNPNPPLTCEDGDCDDDRRFNPIAPYFGDDCDDTNACTLGPEPGKDCSGRIVTAPTPAPVPTPSPPPAGSVLTFTATPLDAKVDQEITLTWNSTAPPASYCDGYYPQAGFQFNTDRQLFGTVKGRLGGPGEYRYEVVCNDVTGKRIGSLNLLIIVGTGTTPPPNSEEEQLKAQIRSQFGVTVEGSYGTSQLHHMINVMRIAGIGNLYAIKDSLEGCPDAAACMAATGEMYLPRSLGNWFGRVFVHELYHAIDAETGYGYADRVGQSLANGNYDIRQNLLQGRSQYSGTNHIEFWAELGMFYWQDRDGLSQRAQSQKNAGYAEPMAQYNIIAEQRGHAQLSQTGSKNIFAAVGDILRKSSSILMENVSAQSLPETASMSEQFEQDLVQDATGPSIRILSPINKATLVTSNILITGKALSNPKDNTPVAGVQIVHNGSSTVIVPRPSNCGSRIVLNCYTWQKLITLSSGQNIISVAAIDTVGQLSSTPLQISLTYNPDLKVAPSVQVQCSTDNGVTFQESCKAGTEALLRWEVLNLTKCTTTETGRKSSWSNVGKNVRVSGMSVILADATNLSKTYTMSCTGPGGTIKDTLKVTFSKIKTSSRAQIPTDLESLLYSSLIALIGTALYTMYTRTMKHKIRIQ